MAEGKRVTRYVCSCTKPAPGFWLSRVVKDEGKIATHAPIRYPSAFVAGVLRESCEWAIMEDGRLD